VYGVAGWEGCGDERTGLAAFLFTWPDGKVRRKRKRFLSTTVYLRDLTYTCTTGRAGDPFIYKKRSYAGSIT
jgi:hypothetical protein